MNTESQRIRVEDIIVGLVLGALSLTAAGITPGWGMDVAVATLLFAAPLARRRWPLVTVCVLMSMLVVAAFREQMGIGDILAAGLTSYIIRRDVQGRIKGVATVALLVGDAIGVLFVSPAIVQQPLVQRLPYLIWSMTFLVAAGLFGELRRRAEDERARELEQSLAAQRKEFEKTSADQRTHIAREIHDLVTHSLTVIVAQADGALYSGENTKAKDEALKAISKVGRESLKQMRSVVGLLREDGGHSASPSIGYRDIPELVRQMSGSGLAVAFGQVGEPGPVSDATSLTMYRIVQEALTNAKKHGTGRADVRIEWLPTSAKLQVDNRADVAEPGQGHGLTGMRERAELLGGTCTAGLVDGQWRVAAALPLNPQPGESR